VAEPVDDHSVDLAEPHACAAEADGSCAARHEGRRRAQGRATVSAGGRTDHGSDHALEAADGVVFCFLCQPVRYLDLLADDQGIPG
jgi:hypothetical protein